MNNFYINTEPLSFDEKLKIENIIYKENIISNNILPKKYNEKNIFKRNLKVFYDKSYNLPQNIFTLKYKDNTIVGRKIRSELHINNKINGMHCSKITASMILGILHKKETIKETIKISFYPFKDGEKLTIFGEISKDRTINIEYPFRYKDYILKKEKSSSENGWSLNPNKVIYLGYGEEHIRAYTKEYLLKYKLIKDNDIIYDPACSTGQFLYEIKKYCPSCKTIGQDLSTEMVSHAKNYVDEIYCENAINTPISNNSIDILILRFLNSEVVSTTMAYRLFKKLIMTVNKGGFILLFGHTPILIREKYLLKRKDLRIIHSNGYCKNTNSIFQYYILEKL